MYLPAQASLLDWDDYVRSVPHRMIGFVEIFLSDLIGMYVLDILFIPAMLQFAIIKSRRFQERYPSNTEVTELCELKLTVALS